MPPFILRTSSNDPSQRKTPANRGRKSPHSGPLKAGDTKDDDSRIPS